MIIVSARWQLLENYLGMKEVTFLELLKKKKNVYLVKNLKQ